MSKRCNIEQEHSGPCYEYGHGKKVEFERIKRCRANHICNDCYGAECSAKYVVYSKGTPGPVVPRSHGEQDIALSVENEQDKNRNNEDIVCDVACAES